MSDLVRRVALGMIAAGVVNATAACATAPRCRPAPPLRLSEDVQGLPSQHDAAQGTGSITFAVISEATRGPLRRRLDVRCGTVEVALTTGENGVARVSGVPEGPCRVEFIGASGQEDVRSWQQPADAKFRGNLRSIDAPRVVARAPADAMPRDVVLERESSGCLGRCRRFTLQLHRDGRLELERDFARRNVQGTRTRRWRLTRAMTRSAIAQAQCLANGPSYDAQPLDLVTRSLTVRDGDAVVYYHHFAHDPRLPAANARRLRRLDQTLLLPPGAWAPRPRADPPTRRSPPPSK